MSLNIKQLLENKSNDYSDLEKRFFQMTKKQLSFDSHLINTNDVSKILSASIVIPAWNAEDTILTCLTSIEQSSFNQKFSKKLQVIVVDDGSSDNTLRLLKNSSFDLNLTIVHQDNHGQGQAMNAGISVAEGDIFIEVDADMIVNYYAIENLMSRHQFYKDALYTGFRSHIDKNDKRVNIEYIKKHGSDRNFHFITDERIDCKEAGLISNMCISSNHYKDLGYSRGLWMENDLHDPWVLADMVFGMLFSLPREIINKIGGFDDRFKGWGCDDGYVGAKAISEGVFVIPLYSATGFHIIHPFRTKNQQVEYAYNRKFFFEFIRATNYPKHPDWISKANKRIIKKIEKQSKNKFSKEIVKSDYELTHKDQMDVEHLLAVGKYSEAYKRLLENVKKNHTYVYNLSQALFGLKRYDECIMLLEKELKNRIEKSEDLLFQCALAHSSLGNFAKAKMLLKKLSKINPDFPKLTYLLKGDLQIIFQQGVNYYKQEFYAVAQKYFEAVLIMDPSNKNALEYRINCIENFVKK